MTAEAIVSWVWKEGGVEGRDIGGDEKMLAVIGKQH